jgi:hypothetical protein
MSQRNRSETVVLPPKTELRAHARGERHRINTELHATANELCGGLEPDDTIEPGAAWKPIHHHDADRAKADLSGQGGKRHWKMKMWKRRSAARRAKAEAFQLAIKNS